MGAFLASAFGGLVSFFAQWVTKKTALGVTMITTIAALTLALYLTLKLLVASLLAVIVNKWVLIGMAVVWPPNADACVAAMFACDIAVFLYRTHIENIKAIAYIT